MRSLESEQRRLADELRTALQRYEIALRGSHVTVFTQDPAFRFTSISNPLFGLKVDEILGRTDADILPLESGAQFRALEQAVLASGQARGSEVSVLEDGKTRWYDLHIEPLPDVTGNIAGLACAAVDVTERKAGEAHLRLLDARADAPVQEPARRHPGDGAANRPARRHHRGLSGALQCPVAGARNIA